MKDALKRIVDVDSIALARFASGDPSEPDADEWRGIHHFTAVQVSVQVDFVPRFDPGCALLTEPWDQRSVEVGDGWTDPRSATENRRYYEVIVSSFAVVENDSRAGRIDWVTRRALDDDPAKDYDSTHVIVWISGETWRDASGELAELAERWPSRYAPAIRVRELPPALRQLFRTTLGPVLIEYQRRTTADWLLARLPHD